MKIPRSKLFQGEYLFSGGSTYLLENKCWGSSYFPLNDYWVVIIFSVTSEKKIIQYGILVFLEAQEINYWITLKKNMKNIVFFYVNVCCFV